MISSLYQGSVKDLLGPVQCKGKNGKSTESIVFQYSDAFSVFDWGRMPDDLPGKGAALAIMAADFLEKFEKPETWAQFSGSPEAMALRKGISKIQPPTKKTGVGSTETPVSLSSNFNDWGERLQRNGLQTHLLGCLGEKEVSEFQEGTTLSAAPLAQLTTPTKYLAVKKVDVVRPLVKNVLGREILDYHPTRNARPPALIPLEVIFRFSCPDGSSLIKRVKKNPDYLSTLPLPRTDEDSKVEAGTKWELPLIEFFTKLESTDRPISSTEALAISGLAAEKLEELVLKTVWVAGLMKSLCSRVGIELADGKLEWAVDESGDILLVDAVGPDEVRLLKDGVQLSKQFLRNYYRKTPWKDDVEQAQAQAEAKGITDWKRLVSEPPPKLPSGYVELGSQIYLSLTNEFTGKKIFANAWELPKVIEELKKVSERSKL